MHAFLVSAAAFIVLVGIMVVVHEAGHFVVAKLCGVRVEAFSIGFGPRLFGFTLGETDYKVCLLPFGGFVKMTGEHPEQNLEVPGTPVIVQAYEKLPGQNQATADRAAADGSVTYPADDPGSFLNHPRWQRMLIGLAGPIANFILAFGLMIFYYGFINEVPAIEVKTPTIEWVTPESAAAQAGFKPGDRIVRFDVFNSPDWDQIDAQSRLNSNQTIPVTVQRDSQTLELSLHVPAAAKTDSFDISDEGLLPQEYYGPIKVDDVSPGLPAEQAGLRAGDAIEAVDGHPFHTVSTLLVYMQEGQGKPINLTVLRNGQTINLIGHPTKLDNGYKLGFTVAPMSFKSQPLPFAQALAKSNQFFGQNSFIVLEVLQRLFTHKVAISQLQGPVGIARMAGVAAEIKGWEPKFTLAAEISINLGILNLLPFPILDGGMIMFLIIESFMKRDINFIVKERIYQAAFVVLLVFFAFIMFSDVTKLPMFTHIKP
ncbi:MAG TPA: RIP metalloprotease RseP [Terracidiphilus sp.]|nr:RIP metalloprotease RseP [Terracidiphilus sp.]